MLESLNTNTFEYIKLSPEEMKKRGILGRLQGVIADTKNPTRNGRTYGKALWENVFENPIMQEKIKNRCCFGELNHPEERTETDLTKVAICLAEQPKLGKDGNLYGIFDILPTPNGNILKTLCDYGCNIGISSRGTGDVIEDENGNEIVDPDTYECECFDAVLIPAVETARLNYVTESLNTKKTLKQALLEDLNKAEPDKRVIMEETLKNLNIDINTDNSDNNKQVLKEDKKKEANNDGSEVIKVLQEAVKGKSNLEKEVKSLQEKLAVSNAKVDELKEELERAKSTSIRLSDSSLKTKELTKKVSSLEETIKEQKRVNESLKKRISDLRGSKFNEGKKLQEELTRKKEETDKEVKKLQEQLEAQKNAYEKQISKLNENLKKVNEGQVKDLNKKLTESQKTSEKYQRLAQDIADKYIAMRAKNLGVTPNEIINRLNESYTTDDIDKVCEDLRNYSIRISKLPFNVEKGVKMRVTESQEQKIKSLGFKGNSVNEDDLVDDTLIELAGLTKNKK